MSIGYSLAEVLIWQCGSVTQHSMEELKMLGMEEKKGYLNEPDLLQYMVTAIQRTQDATFGTQNKNFCTFLT